MRWRSLAKAAAKRDPGNSTVSENSWWKPLPGPLREDACSTGRRRLDEITGVSDSKNNSSGHSAMEKSATQPADSSSSVQASPNILRKTFNACQPTSTAEYSQLRQRTTRILQHGCGSRRISLGMPGVVCVLPLLAGLPIVWDLPYELGLLHKVRYSGKTST